MKRILIPLLLGIAVFATSESAHAGLVDTTVTVEFSGGFNAGPVGFLVDSPTPYVEVACVDAADPSCAFFGGGGLFAGLESIDIGDLSVTLDLRSGFGPSQVVTFSGSGFSDLTFAGVSSSIAWFTQADVEFVNNVLTLGLAEDPEAGGGGTAVISFRASAQPAPEPSTLLLLSGGLLALGLRRSRRRRL